MKGSRNIPQLRTSPQSCRWEKLVPVVHSPLSATCLSNTPQSTTSVKKFSLKQTPKVVEPTLRYNKSSDPESDVRCWLNLAYPV